MIKRLPKKMLYGELQAGKCSHGGQKKRYNDTLKASLKNFNLPAEMWEQIAENRAKWQGLIRKGAGEYEGKRLSNAEQKRAQWKPEQLHHQQNFLSQISLILSAKKQYRAKIGLISHCRTHKQ